MTMIETPINVFIVYGLGAETIFDYVAHRLWRASRRYTVEYHRYPWDETHGNSPRYNPSHAQRDKLRDKISKADCVIVLWTPPSRRPDGESLPDQKVQAELNVLFEIQNDSEVKHGNSTKTKDPKKIMERTVVARWYRNDSLPSKLKPQDDIDVSAEDSIAKLISRVNEICDIGNKGEPGRATSVNKHDRVKPFVPLDQSTVNLCTAILRTFASWLDGYLLNDLHGSGMTRAALYWRHPNEQFLYIIMASREEYSIPELRLKLLAANVEEAFKKERNNWVHIIQEENSTKPLYDELTKLRPSTADQNQKRPILARAIWSGSKLKGIMIVDSPRSVLEGKNWKKWLGTAPDGEYIIVAEYMDKLTTGGNGLIPEKPLSYRHYLNLQSLLRAIRLAPNLDIPIYASLFHTNNKADLDISRAPKDNLEASKPEDNLEAIHPSIVSPTIEELSESDEFYKPSNENIDDNNELTINRIATAQLVYFKKGQGFVGQVWKDGVYLPEDRSFLDDLEDDNERIKVLTRLDNEHPMETFQAHTFCGLRSLVAFPIYNGKEPIGVLGIFSRQSLRQSQLDAHTYFYWLIVETIERILSSNEDEDEFLEDNSIGLHSSSREKSDQSQNSQEPGKKTSIENTDQGSQASAHNLILQQSTNDAHRKLLLDALERLKERNGNELGIYSNLLSKANESVDKRGKPS